MLGRLLPEDIFQGKVNLGMQITETANHFLSRDTKKMQEPPFLLCIIRFASKYAVKTFALLYFLWKFPLAANLAIKLKTQAGLI